MTDCEIKVQGKPGIRVHRLVLAAASPYFRALLQSQMQEKVQILNFELRKESIY